MALDYMLVRRPYILAHRGASAYAPENTFAAFDRALALRADGIEVDVQATSDGVLVLMHDKRVDRTTDGEGRLADMTYEELARLDAGGPYNPRFAGERVPKLEAFLERYGRRLPLCIEVKQLGVETAVIEEVRQRGLLTGRPSDDIASPGRVALPPVTFTSFDWDTCLALKQAAPDAFVGWLTRTFDEAAIRQVADARLEQICPRAADSQPELVMAARDRRLSVRAWAVSQPELLRQAIAAGVDGATCDWPDWTTVPTR